MFDEVVNRESRWRVFWPDVRDLSGAQEAIRLAVWLAYLAAAVTAVVTVIGLLTGANILSGVISILFFGSIGLGMQRGWRSAAVIGTTLLALGVIAALARGIFPGVITPFVLVGLINGVRGTFAARRLRSTTGACGAGS
jgi:hypothetical protein